MSGCALGHINVGSGFCGDGTVFSADAGAGVILGTTGISATKVLLSVEGTLRPHHACIRTSILPRDRTAMLELLLEFGNRSGIEAAEDQAVPDQHHRLQLRPRNSGCASAGAYL